jgi:hypothetical protein
VRLTRAVLFSLLAAVILGSIALIITSYVERGPAHTFHLVPERPATNSELETDAAAMVRRLQGIGFRNTQASVTGRFITLTIYGNGSQIRSALDRDLAAASFVLRPVECATLPFSGLESQLTSRPHQPLVCAKPYVLSAKALDLNTHTGAPTRTVGPDPNLAVLSSNTPGTDYPSRTVLLDTAATSGWGDDRLVCGPSEIANAQIASVAAVTIGTHWGLDITFGTTGADSLDALGQRQFHAYIAVDIDGSVVSTQIVQPKNGSFVSFGGQLQVDGYWTRTEASTLANNMTSPLSVPVKVASSS